MLRLRRLEKKAKHSLTELEAAVEAMKNVPWTALQEMKGNAGVLQKIEDAQKLLQALRKALE